MPTLKLTSKRQATLPKELCDEMAVRPGSRIAVERRVIDGETVWVLRPDTFDWSWIGSVSVPADTPHDMDAVRASVEAARRRGQD